MLIVKSSILILFLISIGVFFSNIIREKRKHKNFNKWMDFQEKVREIAIEADQANKIRIMEYLLSIMPDNAEEGAEKYKHIERYKKEIFERFGDHIPTFKREYLEEQRERKLNQLLNDKKSFKIFRNLFKS
jgi:hypothetical protein